MNNTLQKDIQDAINRASAENGSNTPDFILAQYLMACLKAFDEASLARSNWHGHEDGIVTGTGPIRIIGR